VRERIRICFWGRGWGLGDDAIDGVRECILIFLSGCDAADGVRECIHVKTKLETAHPKFLVTLKNLRNAFEHHMKVHENSASVK
jgi:hypothetical protein